MVGKSVLLEEKQMAKDELSFSFFQILALPEEVVDDARVDCFDDRGHDFEG